MARKSGWVRHEKIVLRGVPVKFTMKWDSSVKPGAWVVTADKYRGVVTQGDNVTDARAMFKEAFELLAEDEDYQNEHPELSVFPIYKKRAPDRTLSRVPLRVTART